MKRIFMPLLLCFYAFAAHGQATIPENEYVDGKWVLKGVAGINLSQTSVSNWAAGGENSVAENAYLNGTLFRKKDNWLWQNDLILEYGLSRTKSNGLRKINDNINFSTQLGYTKDHRWYYTVMGNLRTQFYKGYNYPNKDNYISKFFAPAYSNISAGVEYRPNTRYSIYFSPLSAKMTFVMDDYLSDLGAFGVDPGNKFRIQLGAFLKARMEEELMENVKLISTVDFFTAYDKTFGNVDIHWDILLSMKINKFLSATLNMTLLYDDDVKSIRHDGSFGGPKVQFKEILGVGLAYNF